MKRFYPVLALVGVLVLALVIYMFVRHPGQSVVESLKVEKARLEASTIGTPDAQMEMARRLFIGEGIEKDETKGAQWTKLAADNGSVRAQGLMGVLYLGGIGVEQNFEEARKWFSISPDQEAQVLAQQLQMLMEATAKLPEAEQAARMKENYAAAQKDIRSSFLKVLEKPVSPPPAQQ